MSPTPIRIRSSFRAGPDGWTAGVSDYPLHLKREDGSIDYGACLRPLPSELNRAELGWYLQAWNTADDVFLYLARLLTAADGIRPSTGYRAEFEVEFASNAPAKSQGIGGSPGSSVYMKVGGSPHQPVAVIPPEGGDAFVSFSLDKGNQAQSGADMTTIGNVANGLEEFRWAIAGRTGVHAHAIRSSSAGHLWLAIGTDSGFEGLNQIYYTSVGVELVPA